MWVTPSIRERAEVVLAWHEDDPTDRSRRTCREMRAIIKTLDESRMLATIQGHRAVLDPQETTP